MLLGKMCVNQNLKGVLGLRCLNDFSVSLMASHIWSILTHRDSLWVKWVHAYKLDGRSVWDVPCMAHMSWGWRKLM